MADERGGAEMEAELWAGPMGERWLAHVDQFESMLEGVGDAVIAKGGFTPGERVIDVGCGGGATSMAIARLVGPEGLVTGLDISPALVRAAAQRARAAGVDNIEFRLGDAGAAPIAAGSFDRLFSRFGVMFFPEPHAAFAHMHGFLRPGGGLIFACWGPPEQNTWMAELRQTLGRHIDMNAAPAPPRAPGPFAFAEPDYVRDILASAGFSGVEIVPWRGRQAMGGRGADARTAMRFATEALPFGDALAELAPDARQRALDDLESTFARHVTPNGVEVDAMVWFVTAAA